MVKEIEGNEKGFGLVEVLLAISVVSIFLGALVLGLDSEGKFSESGNVEAHFN